MFVLEVTDDHNFNYSGQFSLTLPATLSQNMKGKKLRALSSGMTPSVSPNKLFEGSKPILAIIYIRAYTN